MTREHPGTSWAGEALTVDVLHSRPGVAQQILVGHGDRYLLVDVGDGCLRDLLDADRDLRMLSALAFTHGHFDHMGGLHALLGFLRMIGRAEPLPIVGPRGCAELWSTLETFRECYAGSIPFEIEAVEVDDRSRVVVDDVEIEAFEVVHCGSIAGGRVLDRIPATGYRITKDGETVAISGDTGTDADLEALVEGADLALIEATMQSADPSEPEVLARVHLSRDVAEAIGARAKRFMLVHRGRWSIATES